MSTRPNRRSLADSFRPAAAPPDRAAALAGVLPPKPVHQARTAPVLPPLAAVAANAGSGRPAIRELDSARVRNVAVYLPVPLLERCRRTTRSRELTYAELLVEAATVHLDELGASFAPPRPAAGPGMPARPARRQPGPGVQVQIRLDGHQLAWLDQQVHRLGAPSRTALVTALLRAHLGEPA